jgi:hypothetical protein
VTLARAQLGTNPPVTLSCPQPGAND